jgi:hypothetical protein
VRREREEEDKAGLHSEDSRTERVWTSTRMWETWVPHARWKNSLEAGPSLDDGSRCFAILPRSDFSRTSPTGRLLSYKETTI